MTGVPASRMKHTIDFDNNSLLASATAATSVSSWLDKRQSLLADVLLSVSAPLLKLSASQAVVVVCHRSQSSSQTNSSIGELDICTNSGLHIHRLWNVVCELPDFSSNKVIYRQTKSQVILIVDCLV